MKIFCYIRVSTEHQVESGLGLEAQKKACDNFAKNLGAEVSELFRDDGLSGSLSIEKRPGLLDAISTVKKGDVLVVARRDRLGRDPLVLAMIESAITRKGARIASASGEGTQSDDPSSILMRRMIDAFSEYERLIIKARIKAALRVKKDRGQRVGHIPFGYKLADDNIHLIPDEQEQTTLKELQKLLKKGLSIRKTAKFMNDKKILNRGNAPWNHASVWRIVSNSLATAQ